VVRKAKKHGILPVRKKRAVIVLLPVRKKRAG
jgi:hypothetical protein